MTARSLFTRMVLWVTAAVAAAWVGYSALAVSTTQPSATGPDTVLLDGLVSLYDAVPFDHKTHAKMAQMWDGCTNLPSPHASAGHAAGRCGTWLRFCPNAGGVGQGAGVQVVSCCRGRRQ